MRATKPLRPLRPALLGACALLAVAFATPAARAQSLGLGAACQVSANCGSSNCVAGICCDSACTSSCQSCFSSLTGFTDGVCRPVAAGKLDPQGLCGAPVCSGSTLSGGACNGNGGCQTASTSCAPFACSAQGNGCNQTCSSDSDCAPGASCDGVTCNGAEGGLGSGPRSYNGPEAWSCAMGAGGGKGAAIVLLTALMAGIVRRRRAA